MLSGGFRYGSGMGQISEDWQTPDVAAPVKGSPLASSSPYDLAPPSPRIRVGHALPGREPQSLGPSVARAGQTVGQNSPHGCRYPNIAITGMKVIHNGTCGIGVRDARDHSISGSIERLSWELPAGIRWKYKEGSHMWLQGYPNETNAVQPPLQRVVSVPQLVSRYACALPRRHIN